MGILHHVVRISYGAPIILSRLSGFVDTSSGLEYYSLGIYILRTFVCCADLWVQDDLVGWYIHLQRHYDELSSYQVMGCVVLV